MNLFKSTSQHQINVDLSVHSLVQGKKWVLGAILIAFSCFAYSPVWAGDYAYTKVSVGSIHLTGLSINISPGGLYFGIGGPFYGPSYGHSYGRFAPRPYWKHSRHHHRRHHHYGKSHRHNHGHGWKNDRHRGKGGQGGRRGNGGRRGGRR